MKRSNSNIKRKVCFAAVFLTALLLLASPAAATEANGKLYFPGGMPFGVKITTPGVMIIGTSEISCGGEMRSPARQAGLKAGDTIKAVDKKEVKGIGDITSALDSCGGKALEISYIRGNEEHTTSLTPLIPDGEKSYKAGMWMRDSMAGIGTVTFIDPETKTFGGLGHGICDSESEQLIPFDKGSISSVTISGVIKGKAGTPGELRGYFSPGSIGELCGNSECGVFGTLSSLPDTVPEGPLPVASPNEIHDGDAYIWCTLDKNNVQRFKVSLSDISHDPSKTTKCFTVTVTDQALIELSGGIVQGMSGSPIIQDGKLVGAITHVLISDPTKGYGIFLENMLETAQSTTQEQLKRVS